MGKRKPTQMSSTSSMPTATCPSRTRWAVVSARPRKTMSVPTEAVAAARLRPRRVANPGAPERRSRRRPAMVAPGPRSESARGIVKDSWEEEGSGFRGQGVRRIRGGEPTEAGKRGRRERRGARRPPKAGGRAGGGDAWPMVWRGLRAPCGVPLEEAGEVGGVDHGGDGAVVAVGVGGAGGVFLEEAGEVGGVDGGGSRGSRR